MSKKPYLLLLPVIFLSLIFIVGILYGLIQSFGIIPSLGMKVPTLKYYQELFTRPELLSSIGMSLYIAFVSSILATILGVLICSLLVLTGKGKGKVMHLVKIPIAIPHIVVAMFVMLIFAQSGLLARVLFNLGLLESPNAFPTLLYSQNGIGIILAYLWKEIPFVIFFVITIMANINTSLGEAAENLGASRWRAFIDITLPLSMPSIKNAFLIIFAYNFGAYELPYLLGATAPRAIPVQAYIEYIHPDLLHRPYAMALNGIMFLVSFIIVLIYHRTVQRNPN
ncbi:MAG: ABC transporter permease subunit [Desulfitobacterium sp.]|nr:ABC transporter permease subunit [Desulfitobacterium sp.]